MSHALALVQIPSDADVQDAVQAALAPYSEHTNDDGWWDYWTLGGRWLNSLPRTVGTLDELDCDGFTIVTPERVVHRETWNGSEWVETGKEFEEFFATLDRSALFAAVDYHS